MVKLLIALLEAIAGMKEEDAKVALKKAIKGLDATEKDEDEEDEDEEDEDEDEDEDEEDSKDKKKKKSSDDDGDDDDDDEDEDEDEDEEDSKKDKKKKKDEDEDDEDEEEDDEDEEEGEEDGYTVKEINAMAKDKLLKLAKECELKVKKDATEKQLRKMIIEVLEEAAKEAEEEKKSKGGVEVGDKVKIYDEDEDEWLTVKVTKASKKGFDATDDCSIDYATEKEGKVWKRA